MVRVLVIGFMQVLCKYLRSQLLHHPFALWELYTLSTCCCIKVTGYPLIKFVGTKL